MHAATAPVPAATPVRPHDPVTVLAVAILVYRFAKNLHEAVGHGIVCELVGGEWIAVSSSWCECDKTGVGPAGRRWIEAGGTLVNLAVGAAALLAVRLRGPRNGAAFAFLWLTAAVNLLVGAGYLLVDPLFGFGDWGDLLADLDASLAGRLGTSAVGAALSLGTFFALRSPLDRLLGGTGAERRRQARWLCWWPYFAAGGVVLTGAAALNAYGPAYVWTSALATLGGTFLLLWLPVAVAPGETAPPRPAIRRSAGWLAAGAAMLVFLAVAFGPGIRF
jgi:hypothetical protein